MSQADRAFHSATVVAIAVTVYAIAVVPHEMGHALAGSAVGGTPTLVTSTEVKGNWNGVSDAGIVVLAVSGPAVNALLAAVGLLLLRRSERLSGASHLFAWLFTAVNGFLPAVYMAVAPLIRFGDWDTALRRLEPELPLRIATIAIGVALTVAWVRLIARRMPPLLIGGSSGERESHGRRLVAISMVSGAAICALAATFSPLGLLRGWFIALGASFGCSWPMLPAARLAAGIDDAVAPTPKPVRRSVRWIVVGTVCGLLMVSLFGPGVRL